jgi:hypothetical protein
VSTRIKARWRRPCKPHNAEAGAIVPSPRRSQDHTPDVSSPSPPKRPKASPPK